VEVLILGVLVVAVGVAVRDRAHTSAAALGAVALGLVGAKGDESITVRGSGAAGRYIQPCGPAHVYGSAAVEGEYRRAMTDQVDIVVGAAVLGAVDDSDDWEGEPSENPPKGVTKLAAAFAPRIGLEHRWIAGSVGIAAGRLLVHGDRETAFPVATLRIGPRSAVFADLEVGRAVGGPFPDAFARAGLGVGLGPRLDGAWNHPVLRGGIASSGGYGWVQVPVGEAWMLDAFGSYGDRDTWRVGLGVQFRFDPRSR
jgi:hypothetical protein